jgi:Dirigent-like protein
MLRLRRDAVDSPVEAAIPSNFRLPIASTALGSSSGAPWTILSQETDMPTTIINLKVKTVEEKAITPQNNQLGNMIASSDDITEINGDPSLRGQHSGFYVRVRKPDFWLCEAGCILPGIPGTPFPNGGQLETRGLLKFSSLVNTVAIIGGTEDYRSASGQVKIDGMTFELTIETP